MSRDILRHVKKNNSLKKKKLFIYKRKKFHIPLLHLLNLLYKNIMTEIINAGATIEFMIGFIEI